jgi:uncharacterized BrkB/YihY/UPF0761 family membrane protein
VSRIINNRAWLIATGVGCVVAFVLSAGVQAFGLTDMVRDEQVTISIRLAIVALGFTSYVIYIGVGLLYAWATRQRDKSIGAGPIALGALISTLAVLAFQWLLGALVWKACPGCEGNLPTVGVMVGVAIIAGMLGTVPAAIFGAVTRERSSQLPRAE